MHAGWHPSFIGKDVELSVADGSHFRAFIMGAPRGWKGEGHTRAVREHSTWHSTTPSPISRLKKH